MIPDPIPSAHFLTDLLPSRRALALHAFESRGHLISAEEGAARLVSILSLDDEVDAEDFTVAGQWRDKSLARLLDPSDLTALRGICAAFKVPPESVLSHAIKAYAGIKPDPELFPANDLSL